MFINLEIIIWIRIFSKMLSSNFEGKKGWFIMVNGFMQADTPNPWHSLKNPTLAGRL